MKARSAAAKRRARAGRPKKQNAERHPCGKINQDWSKQESEKEAMATVIDARQRIHGVNKAQARSMLSGSVLGLLFLDGKITEPQLKAGTEYGEKMARYYGLTGVQFPSPRAQALFAISGDDGETTASHAEAARKAADKAMKMEGALLRCKDGPQVKTTVRNVCLLDYENLRTMPEKQLGWLRSGLHALVMHFGVADFAQIG